MLIFLYVILCIFILLYQNCFMLNHIFRKATDIGNLFLLLSFIMIIPILIVGGWKHILIYIGVSLIAYVVSLIIAFIVYKVFIKKIGS